MYIFLNVMSLYQNNKKYIKITEQGKSKSKHFYIKELFTVEISALYVFNIRLKSYQNKKQNLKLIEY